MDIFNKFFWLVRAYKTLKVKTASQVSVELFVCFIKIFVIFTDCFRDNNEQLSNGLAGLQKYLFDLKWFDDWQNLGEQFDGSALMCTFIKRHELSSRFELKIIRTLCCANCGHDEVIWDIVP